MLMIPISFSSMGEYVTVMSRSYILFIHFLFLFRFHISHSFFSIIYICMYMLALDRDEMFFFSFFVSWDIRNKGSGAIQKKGREYAYIIRKRGKQNPNNDTLSTKSHFFSVLPIVFLIISLLRSSFY